GCSAPAPRPWARRVPVFPPHGRAPDPDCFSTLALLGGLGSASTVQRGEPPPVLPHFQPAGAAPGLSASNLTASARAPEASTAAAAPRRIVAIMGVITPPWISARTAPQRCPIGSPA